MSESGVLSGDNLRDAIEFHAKEACWNWNLTEKLSNWIYIVAEKFNLSL